MAFFDEIGKKISYTSQGALQKTKDFADVAKLNSSINDEEKLIKSYYYQIGQKYYELFNAEPIAELSSLVEAIGGSLNKINRLREQIRQIKGMKACPNCGAEMAISLAFCSACGHKIPIIINEVPPSVNAVTCVKCGALVEQDQRFCTSCGNLISIAADCSGQSVESGCVAADSRKMSDSTVASDETAAAAINEDSITGNRFAFEKEFVTGTGADADAAAKEAAAGTVSVISAEESAEEVIDEDKTIIVSPGQHSRSDQ